MSPASMRLGILLAAGSLACAGQSPIDTGVNDSIPVPVTQPVAGT